MVVNDRRERLRVQREEGGTHDGTLRDPSSETTRIRHRLLPGCNCNVFFKTGTVHNKTLILYNKSIVPGSSRLLFSTCSHTHCECDPW